MANSNVSDNKYHPTFHHVCVAPAPMAKAWKKKVLSDDVKSFFENAGLMTPLVNNKGQLLLKPSMAHQFPFQPHHLDISTPAVSKHSPTLHRRTTLKSPNTYAARKHTNISVSTAKQPFRFGTAIWIARLWSGERFYALCPRSFQANGGSSSKSIADDWSVMEALGINRTVAARIMYPEFWIFMRLVDGTIGFLTLCMWGMKP